jgi:ABC-2 type transport system permease protein
MKIFSVTLKDLQVFLKDRGAVFMLFLMPFVFIVPFAFLTKNVHASASKEELLALTVANHDPDSAVTQEFLADLEGTGIFAISQEPAEKIEYKLNNSTIRYALVIPAGFSADLSAGNPVTLRLMVHPVIDETTLITVQRGVGRAVRSFLMMDFLNQGLEQMAAMQAANPEAKDAFSKERIEMQIEEQRLQAAQRPLIVVEQTTPASLGKKEQEANLPSYGQTIVVGMTVLFVFLGAQNTAMSIFKEKRQGSFRRLTAAPISKAELLTGKLLPNFLLSLVQIAFIFLLGGFLIRLVGIEPLDLSADPLALVLISLVMALCASSLGILIAAIARSENQVGGLSTVLLFVAGLLSGSFIPLFLFPEGMANLARIIPQFWANQAYYNLIFRGQTFADVWVNIAALAVFTLAFFGVGLWRFKFE